MNCLIGDKITPNKFIYHKSSKSNRISILENGILPKVGNYYLDAITDINVDISDCVPSIYANNIKNKEEFFANNKDYDIWEIDTVNLSNEWYIDKYLNDGEKYILTIEKIPTENIKLIHMGEN